MKNFDHLTIILFISFLLLGCNKDYQDIFYPDGKVVLSGVIKNYSPQDDYQSIMLRVPNILKSISYTDAYLLNIDSVSGQFSVAFDKSYTGTVIFDYGDFRHHIIASPNDSIFFTFNNNDIIGRENKYLLPASLDINCTNSTLNSEIVKFFKQYSYIDFYPSPIKSQERTAEEYLNELKKTIKIKKQLIDDYIIQENASDLLDKYLYNSLVYSTANLILDFKIMNKKSYNRDVLYDFSVFPLDNPNAIICSNYRVFINNYIQDIIWADTTINKLNNEGSKVEAYTLIFNKIEALATRSLIKDICFSMFLDDLMTKDFITFSKIYPDLKTKIHNEIIRESINNDYLQRIEKQEVNSRINLQSKDHDLNSLLHEINNKLNTDYYLVDIWHPGCGPCISAMPKLYEINKELSKSNTSIVFFCSPTDSIRWNDLVNKFGPCSGHFLLNKHQNKLLQQKLHFSGVPKYFIMDKNGNIPYEDIDRIEKKHIENLISKLSI